jgi:hypothetical protein
MRKKNNFFFALPGPGSRRNSQTPAASDTIPSAAAEALSGRGTSRSHQNSTTHAAAP